MARKLKIMENEKLPLDDLKNDEITKKRETRKCRSRAGTEIYIQRELRRQKPWMILTGNS